MRLIQIVKGGGAGPFDAEKLSAAAHLAVNAWVDGGGGTRSSGHVLAQSGTRWPR